MKTYLAFDIGGTKLKYALINDQGQLLKTYSENTIKTSQAEFLKRFNEIIQKFQSQISGIGISVPGKVNVTDQSISFGGSLPFLDGVSFSKSLDTKLSIFVENDAKAATLAEIWQGSLKEVKNGVMLVLGTAIGSGIVLNHQLVYGSHQQAGEVSFMSCGKFDMDDLMGGRSSAVGLIQDIASHYELEDINDGPKVFELIKSNDTYAKERFQKFCRNVALLIHNMQTVLDVDQYVIGGGISHQAIVAEGINKAFDELRAENKFVNNTLTKPQIVSSKLYNAANLYGSISRFEMVTEGTNELKSVGNM
ncbi:ROK family protein [Companilactobacillus huachuanensis]|uniref:ROK family protein n=1 Tax=Companilactobacillus huachuanensis TaxID=2559914 RepID=A0ABW1RKB7_9LACO|nr:ROK family protein [Companilactobacillus huachuanensis]